MLLQILICIEMQLVVCIVSNFGCYFSCCATMSNNFICVYIQTLFNHKWQHGTVVDRAWLHFAFNFLCFYVAVVACLNSWKYRLTILVSSFCDLWSRCNKTINNFILLNFVLFCRWQLFRHRCCTAASAMSSRQRREIFITCDWSWTYILPPG